MLYPLKFKPIYKTPIWGGNRISGLPGKKNVPPGCGESWEISTVENNSSVVSEGFLKGNSLEELIEIYMGDLVGEKVYSEYGLVFPILVKIIDASDDLSVQVHPDDEYAYTNHNTIGKTEMWYVMQADKGAEIINGFAGETDENRIRSLIDGGRLSEVLNKIPATDGDVHFIPAGRVHAIGKGVLLAEFQQCSDVTYRLFDWGRKDINGNSRELHIEDAVKVLDYSKEFSHSHPEKRINKSVNLVNCDYFNVNLLSVLKEFTREYVAYDSFVILMCTSGKCTIKCSNDTSVKLNTGETVLIPALIENVTFISEKGCDLLECYIL